MDFLEQKQKQQDMMQPIQQAPEQIQQVQQEQPQIDLDAEAKLEAKRKERQIILKNKAYARQERQRIRNERKLQKAVQEQENERKERERVLQQEKERTAQRFSALRETTGVAALKISKKTVLAGEFKSAFTSKVKDKDRLKKQENKRSRLFAKKNNAAALKGVDVKVKEEAFKKLENITGQKLDDNPDYYDAAAFMTENKFVNQNILSNLKDGKNKTAAIDHMWSVLSLTNLKDIRLDNDKELAAHAGELEKLSRQIASFESIANKYGYFNGLDEETRKAVQEKLDQLRSIACYYEIRKEVITDPYYMSHYNEELSMDFTAATTPEQKELAKKLTKAYLAGKAMMEKNGASADLIKKQKTPKFANADAAASFMTQRTQAFSSENYKAYMASKLNNEKAARFEGNVDEKIKDKYGNRVDGMIKLTGHSYATKAASYLEVLKVDTYVSKNVYQDQFAEKTFGYASDNADLAYDLADKPSIMNKEATKNHVRAMTHVFKALKSFDLNMYSHLDLDRLKEKGDVTKQRLVYSLACEALPMLKEYEELKQEAAEYAAGEQEGFSDLKDGEFEELRDHIDAITKLGKVYDVAAKFYGSPVAKDYPCDLMVQMVAQGMESFLRQNWEMIEKYGDAWQDFVSNAIYIHENYANEKFSLATGAKKHTNPKLWFNNVYRKKSSKEAPEQQQQVQQNKQEEEEEDFEMEEDSYYESFKDEVDNEDDNEDDIGQGLYGESNYEAPELEEGWHYAESDEQEFRPFMPN